MGVFLLIFVAVAAASEPALIPAPAPFHVDVHDPMLAPLPPPVRVLESWPDALAELTRQSPDERSARGAVERAEGRWRQALAGLLPTVRITGQLIYDILNPGTAPVGQVSQQAAAAQNANPSGRTPTVPLAIASLNVQQPLVDVSAYYGLGSARAAEKSAQESRRDTRRRLVQALSRAIVAVVASERAAELNRLGLAQALERAALTERQRDLGVATELDRVRVRQDVAVARGTLIAGDEQLRRAREGLGAVLGTADAIGVSTRIALDGLAAESGCQPVGDGRRTDVKAAELSVSSARDSRSQAIAGYFPTLGLQSTLVGFTTNPGPGRFATWTIGAVLTIPIWEAGSREGIVRERRGLETQAAATADATERDAAIEIARARRGIAVAGDLVNAAMEARTLAAKTDELTRRSFEVGRATSLELVQTAGVLRQADLVLAAREFELVQAKLDAFFAEAVCKD